MPHATPMWDFCKLWFCQFPYESIRMPYGTLAGPARAPHGCHKIWKTLKIPVKGLYDALTGIARGPCWVLRIIRSNQKCTAMSSRAGPVDHESSTGIKFLRALHLAYGREIVRAGAGPVIGCDWCMRHYWACDYLFMLRLKSKPHISRMHML